MEQIQHRFIRFEQVAAVEGKIDGYASVFGVVDTYQTTFEKGCFLNSLARQSAQGTKPSMFLQHSNDLPVGGWSVFAEDEKGLRVSGQLAKSPIGEHVAQLFQMGEIRGLSIGFYPISWIQDGDLVRFTEVELVEVSLVCNPSNKAATAQLRGENANNIKTIREFESALQLKLGFSARAAKAIAASGFKADVRDEPAQSPNVRDELGKNAIAVSDWAQSILREFRK